MPELPEVEVVKKSLEDKLKNLTIKRVLINNNKLRYRINNKKFYKIKGLKIESVQRRSKYLLINLSRDLTILAHLGMTGKFFIVDSNNKKYKTSFYYSIKKNESKHDHITLYLSKGFKLIYNDVRKFGFLKLFESKKVLQCKHLKLLGPEPLTKEFNLKYINKYLLYKKKTIKDLLMDQKFIAGIGNIYCNEVLFLSKIKPYRISCNIKKKELINVIRYTKKILKNSIMQGGSSIKNFADTEGKNGNFQKDFNVYNREKEKCKTKKCLGLIKKIYISSRSSFFCPRCQK
jgi:formamidopyrimidine-DNA glycosylase